MPVFVLAADGLPVMPCSPKRARLLLERGKAKVIRIKPFTIKLLKRTSVTCTLQPLEVKIDPGSKHTGFSLVRKDIVDPMSVTVLWLMELQHRGGAIKKALLQRATLRRARRSRNTRYRPARFLNRTKPKGWLPPSLMHRVYTTLTWVRRLQRWSSVTSLAVERVKFDLQKLMEPEIRGEEYQQGTLQNYEVKEYLLEKYQRTCVYCGTKEGYLEIEHVVCKADGGTNRISNLTLACRACNLKKGRLPIEVFLRNKPEVLAKVLKQLKKPLKDAAAVNATRNRLLQELLLLGLPVSTGTGAQTKYNRSRLQVHKTHALDAACVGLVNAIKFKTIHHLAVKCMGRGRYQRTLTDSFGFPRAYLAKGKSVKGFSTGDLVRVPTKKVPGKFTIIGRASVRATGYFDIRYEKLLLNAIWQNCKLIQKADGYHYTQANYEFFKQNNGLLLVVKQNKP